MRVAGRNLQRARASRAVVEPQWEAVHDPQVPERSLAIDDALDDDHPLDPGPPGFLRVLGLRCLEPLGSDHTGVVDIERAGAGLGR